MEREFLHWLIQSQEPNRDFVSVGIGDDAAVLSLKSDILVTTDAIADGTHFDLARHPLEKIGRKALAVNLSDLAAMGATPKAALVTLQLPRSFELGDAKKLFTGIRTLARQFETQIVGGDTNRWNEKLQIGITAIGVPFGIGIWKISDARANDVILVSGTLGGSILGNHLDFEPRLILAQHLAANYSPTAVTDASDSLSLDLVAIARASGLGVQIELDSIPVSADAVRLSRTEKNPLTPLDHALYDGEDFELILCASPEESERMLSDMSMPVPLTAIGQMTESRELLARHPDGILRPLIVKGYCH